MNAKAAFLKLEESERELAAAPEYRALSKELEAHVRKLLEVYGTDAPITFGVIHLTRKFAELNSKVEGQE